MPNPTAYLNSISFSDGTKIETSATDIIVIVGPNNVGKSVALRDIHDKSVSPKNATRVVTDVSVSCSGTSQEVQDWLETSCRKQVDRANPNNPSFSRLGITVHQNQVAGFWDQSSTHGLRELGKMFIYRLTTDARLDAAMPASNIQLSSHPLTHPIHYMQVDDRIEMRMSGMFRQAFGEDLIVHRNAGSQVPLHVGGRPSPAPGEDRVSINYIRSLEKLPTLQSQGDGMRAFVGVLLHAFIVEHSAVLIDEPEAFLHPPQARLLGKMLVENAPPDRQLVIATHSGDFLRGLLDASSNRVRIVRIQRDGDVNPVSELNNAGMKELWSDPLLRYSNVLDGVFHSRVIVCESDADCRFYGALRDALIDGERCTSTGDVMFVNAGGKDRIPLVVRSLRDLSVPVTAICDFDLLNAEQTLVRLFESFGSRFETIRADWQQVKASIDSKKPELQTEEVLREIRSVLENTKEQYFPKSASREIQQILRRSSPWSVAKSVGKSAVPSGDPTQACNRMFSAFESAGIFVVDVGEIEGWCRSVGAHGPKWTNQVLQKDLLTDPELEQARMFTARVLESSPTMPQAPALPQV